MSQPQSTKRALIAIYTDAHRQVHEAHVFLTASALAYTTILSIIPALALSFSIFQAFGGLDKLYKTIEPYILQNLAQGTNEQALATIRQMVSNVHGGALGATGFAGLVVSCMSMLYSAEKAINRVWQTEMTRTIFARATHYWFIITLGPLALAFAVGVATSSDLPLTRMLPSGMGAFLVASGLFFLTFKLVPHRKVDWKPATVAGVTAGFSFEMARRLYAIYTAKVLNYSKIYGSLAAIPILLLWIYIIWVIILMGAVFAAALQKRIDQP